MYRYYFSPYALKEIERLPRNLQQRILKRIDFFCSKNPFEYADSLIDSRAGSFRFRIGDYRVIFDKSGHDSILIIKIGHRREIYKR